jgi:hypothetical protein
VDLQTLCQAIQEMLFDVPSQPRSLLNDLEICIGGADSGASGNTSIAEISLTSEMIGLIGRWLGNEVRVKTLMRCTPVCEGASQEQLSEQLFRDGMCETSFQSFDSYFQYYELIFLLENVFVYLKMDMCLILKFFLR